MRGQNVCMEYFWFFVLVVMVGYGGMAGWKMWRWGKGGGDGGEWGAAGAVLVKMFFVGNIVDMIFCILEFLRMRIDNGQYDVIY